MNSAIDGPDKRPTPNTSAPSASTTSDPTSLVARRAGWLVLLGLVVYLTEFVGMAIAGGYPSNEPGTPLAQVPDAYAGLADGTGFLVGWMALVLTGRILIIIGLRAAVGASSLLDWAVTAMVVSVAVEVASVAAMAAAAGLVADGAALEAVLAADRIAWSLSAAVTAPAGLSVLLVAIGMWRSERFPRAAVVGGVIGLVVLGSGLLSAPSTYAVGSALSLGVLVWWGWVLWVGVLLVRRGWPVRGIRSAPESARPRRTGRRMSAVLPGAATRDTDRDSRP